MLDLDFMNPISQLLPLLSPTALVRMMSVNKVLSKEVAAAECVWEMKAMGTFRTWGTSIIRHVCPHHVWLSCTASNNPSTRYPISQRFLPRRVASATLPKGVHVVLSA